MINITTSPEWWLKIRQNPDVPLSLDFLLFEIPSLTYDIYIHCHHHITTIIIIIFIIYQQNDVLPLVKIILIISIYYHDQQDDDLPSVKILMLSYPLLNEKPVPARMKILKRELFFIISWIEEGHHYCPDDDPQQIHISIFVSSVFHPPPGTIY